MGEMVSNVGPMELMLLAVLALLLFGPKELPEVGRSVGKGLREFKDGLSEHTSEFHDALAPLDETRDAVDPLSADTTLNVDESDSHEH